MTNLRFKSVFRRDGPQGHYRLFRIMWETGVVGDGHGHSNMVSVALQLRLFLFELVTPQAWMLVLLGVRVHRKRSFGGTFA